MLPDIDLIMSGISLNPPELKSRAAREISPGSFF